MTEFSNYMANNISLFDGLDGVDFEKIANACSWQRYAKNTQIMNKDDSTSDIFFVVEGAVSARSFSPDGKEVNYIDIPQGEIFGEFSAIDGKPRSATIETIENSLLARMTSSQFRLMMMEQPVMGLKISELLVQKIRDLTQRVFEFGTLNVRERLIRELVRMCDSRIQTDNTCRIDPSPTHYEIAIRIATHREAISRELNDLVSSNLLEVGRRKILIKDVRRLKNLADEDNY